MSSKLNEVYILWKPDKCGVLNEDGMKTPMGTTLFLVSKTVVIVFTWSMVVGFENYLRFVITSFADIIIGHKGATKRRINETN